MVTGKSLLSRSAQLTTYGRIALARSAFLAVALMAFSAVTVRAQTVSEASVTLTGNRPVEAASMSPVSHPEPASQLKMQVSLGLRNRAGLDQLLRDQQN